jgi:hypothetical protein
VRGEVSTWSGDISRQREQMLGLWIAAGRSIRFGGAVPARKHLTRLEGLHGSRHELAD